MCVIAGVRIEKRLCNHAGLSRFTSYAIVGLDYPDVVRQTGETESAYDFWVAPLRG